VRDLAVVSAVELLPAVQSPAEAGPILVDAGAAASTTDSAGRVFEKDRYFTGGAASSVVYDVTGIGDFGNPGSPDDAVFATYHSGREFSFRRPVANGHYALLLDFAEPAEGAAVGSRTFDVFAEGRQILDDYDIVKAAGAARTAVADSSDLTITDGTLDLGFRGVAGDALVSAIVLIPTGVPAAAKPYSRPLVTEAGRQARSAANARQLVYAAQFWGDSHRGKFPDRLADALADVGMLWYDAVASPRTSTRLPRGETLAFPELLAWVSDRNDYVYIGAGSTYRDAPDKVVLYENPDRVEGPIVVGFLDGHVSVLPRDQAAALIGFDANAASADPPPPWPDPASPEYRRDPTVVASRENLYRIFEGLWRHANSNRGFFPVDVVRLMLSQNVPAETVVNPRGDGALPAGLDRFQQAEWVLRHGDYQLLPTGDRIRGTSIPEQVAIAWENPAELKGGIYLAVADGRVEFRELRWAVETIRRSFAWLELWQSRR
jgi:hypothetical protein